MPLPYPRDMMLDWEWVSGRLVLQQNHELARSANGMLQAKDLGPALWQATQYATRPMPRHRADLVVADFLTLRGAINSFYLHDPARSCPISIQGQVAPDLSAVTVDGIDATRRQIRLTGLPIGFVMTSGDYVSVATAAGGVELFRVARAWGGLADGTGTTPYMDVEPYIRPSVVAGDVVTLIKPKVEMRLLPGTLDDPYTTPMHRRITFSATQVIR